MTAAVPSRAPLAPEGFIERLRAEGAPRYHDRHAFNVAMHEGKLTREELQRWVENRFYYQTRIPIKDAIILSKSDDPAFRRSWMHSYVELVRSRTLVEAVASSLTEHFAPSIMRTRIAAWEKHYPWVHGPSLQYFRHRVPRAARDAEEAIAFVVAHATTVELQDACVLALVDKCTILWSMLDVIAEAR